MQGLHDGDHDHGCDHAYDRECDGDDRDYDRDHEKSDRYDCDLRDHSALIPARVLFLVEVLHLNIIFKHNITRCKNNIFRKYLNNLPL